METWTFNSDKTAAVISGRVKKPLSKKLNPIWWLGNSQEPHPPDWYLPDRPKFWRYFCWYLRNPFQNFTSYVIGVEDRNYEVTGEAPVEVIYWNDMGKSGWKNSRIKIGPGLYFFSFSDEKRQIGFGWQPNGHFQLKINL